MSYFDHPAVSTSNLKDLRRLYFGMARIDAAAAFRFGLLVDCLLTEPHLLRGNTITDTDGRVTTYTDEEIKLGRKLAKEVLNDPIVRLLLPGGRGQEVCIEHLSLNFEGVDFTIWGRCKFDWLTRHLNTGIDFKTTACTSLKAFVESIEHFDYDQAAAWYMDLAKIDRFWIIGISKKNSQVFKFAIKRGDDTYNRGRDKYLYWSHKWDVLIGGLGL